MSTVSQTSARPDAPRASRPWLYPLISVAVVGAIVSVSMAPVRASVMRAAGHMHAPHPDWAFAASWPLAVKIHVICALAALAIGAVLMVVRKGRTFHRVGGWTWVAIVATVAGSSLFITGLNRGHFSLLHLLTGWTLLVLPLAVMFARRHEVARHRRMMMGLFYGGFAINIFIAFIPGRAMWVFLFG